VAFWAFLRALGLEMKVFAIGDLHLCGGGDKPMEVFGPEWEDHRGKLERNWWRVVGPQDVVLLCGDLSWAMRLGEARADLEFIGSLPGTKYFIRGNHDFWFGGAARVRAALGESVRLVHLDAHVQGGVGICGGRGWVWPGHEEFDAQRDGKHWRRAQIRLGFSLKALAGLRWDVAVAMLHYPPLSAVHTSELCHMISSAGVSYCAYAHVHGQAARDAFEGERDGVQYRCVSADRVDFTPALICEHGCAVSGRA